MKVAAILLALMCMNLAGCFGSTDQPSGPRPSSLPSFEGGDVTQRATIAGDVVGFIGKHGALTWQGIPFAKPPVGKLRWHPPMPPDSWEGVRRATAFNNFCTQFSNPTTPSQEGVVGSEDCLYLNVYAPANAQDLPVMFWIHGGGNAYGHAHHYDGSRLATSQGVVVVTINYRLGHLGWFSHPAMLTGDPVHDSGNYGTLDIIRALEWTRENIAEFGGDPDNVTAFGESAGGYDVMALVISPLANGLFHRGIVQSGGLSLIPIDQARIYAEEGGHRYSAPEIVNQLLIRDGLAADSDTARQVQDAMDAQTVVKFLYDKTPADLWSLFENQGGSLPTPDLFADGHVLPTLGVEEVLSDASRHNSVPMILGTNRDEPSVFMYASPRHVEATESGRRLRNEGEYLREVKYGGLSWKERGVDSVAMLLTKSGNEHVYAYRFDWDEEGIIDGLDYSKALGAGHAVELPFVFGDFTTGWVLEDIYSNSEQRHLLADSMMSYWTRFAITGDPGNGRNMDLPRWLPWGADGKTTLIFDTPSDQGIHMVEGVVTPASLKADLALDSSIESRRERCARYAQMFVDGPLFDDAEFASFGPDGCEGLDPKEIRGF